MRRNRFDSMDAEHERKDQHPIPIAATLRNLYVPKSCTLSGPINLDCSNENDDNHRLHEKEEEEEDQEYMQHHSNRWTNHLPLHKALVSVEIEIVIPNQAIHHLNQTYTTKYSKRILKKLFGKHDALQGTSMMGDDQDVMILCSKIIERPNSHLLWDHLEDKLDDFYASIPVSTSDTEEDIVCRTNLWNDIQKSMKIRCKAYMPLPTRLASRGTSRVDDIEHKFNMRSIVLSTMDLDINRLKVLPQNTQTSKSSFVLPSSKYNSSLPSALPYNTFLIHFSDGSTRASMGIYDLLLDQKVIRDDVTNRFDDKTFNVLEEQVEYTKAKLSINELSISSTKKIIQKGYSINGDPMLKRDLVHEITPNKGINRGAFVDAFESVSNSANTSKNNSAHANPTVLSDDDISNKLDFSDCNSSDSADETNVSKLEGINDGELDIQTIDNEIQMLNEILQYNQQKVEDELSLQRQVR
jgi:hypothetical protein